MVDYQTLSIVLTGIGMVIALTYYGLQIRNQNRTRQAQLFMGLYDTYRSQEFRELHSEIINQEWENYEEFMEKYGNMTNPDAWKRWTSIGAFYNGIGILLKQGLINIELVEELLSNAVFISWVRMGPIIKGWRGRERRFQGGRSGKYDFFHGFEYLYHELVKWEQQHPELKT